jgi:hypothetical protein
MKREKDERPDGGTDRDAGNWVEFLTEVRYARLGPRDWYDHLPHRELGKAKAAQAQAEVSLFVPGPGKAALAELPATYWLDVRRTVGDRLLREGRKRMRAVGLRTSDGTAPGVPGANNWIPIGPSVVRKGQATGNPPVAGRTNGIAITPGGNRVYVSTADGGVWRSDDAGVSWRSTMDSFDLDPTAFAATSNACGAIAIDPADPNRVYVGTGEGDTNELFTLRLVSALPTYRGVGPIRSDDGGTTWNAEPTDVASPTLVGSACFALAVDPGDRENVVAATTVGLYRREPDGAGGYHWVQKRTGIHTSVVACRSGTTTTFYAAPRGGGVFSSPDGSTWTAVGTGFPAAAGRITLGARPTDPGVLYAFVASGSSFLGVFRLDGGAGSWKSVSGLPSLGSQADYNLPLAVDPNDPNTIYIAGSAFSGNGSIYRCAITSSGAAYSMSTTFIGTGVHADVHALVHAPADSSTLWTGCDGGVFRTTTATGAATFTHRNTGLATLCSNFFSQHPTQPAVIVVGLQDNGTARYTGEEVWRHIRFGDGGYPIINWADPNKVLVYQNGNVFRATDGGQSEASFSVVLSPSWIVMAEPLAGTPYKPASPTDADTVAFGAGTSLYISTDFGATWGAAIALPQNIFALAFASPTRLYVGTTLGQVYRFDKSGATWSQTRIDNVAAGALPISGLITDIEIDPADATGASVYITFGGAGDRRHVWHFDGTAWQDRSGPIAAGLIDVEHNAIVADSLNPSTLYVGCDVGVWQSADSGGTWAPMENGLPDAAVLDLQIHPTARLLRAATHGRSMFEYKLDPPPQADVELYSRDTSLDVGRANTVDGLSDPETWPAQPVLHYLSRNIKVDVPTPAGYQTPTSSIDFLIFNDVIIDGSQQTATIDPATGTVVNRVYVEVHNRGIVQVTSVQVMLLLANASAGLPLLPAGYQANVVSGTPISTAFWQTVGVYTITNLRAGFPQIAPFSLPSTMLPPPASLPGQSHHCLLAFLHSSQDPFTSTQTNADLLTITDRKVAQRNVELVAFVGTPPPPGDGPWARIDFYGLGLEQRVTEIIIDARGFEGRLGLVLPSDLRFGQLSGLQEGKKDIVARWAQRHVEQLRSLIKHGRYSYRGCRQMLTDVRQVAERPIFMGERGERKTYGLSGIVLEPGKRYPLFLYLEPEGLKLGRPAVIHVIQRDPHTKRVEGGCTYHVVLTPGK